MSKIFALILCLYANIAKQEYSPFSIYLNTYIAISLASEGIGISYFSEATKSSLVSIELLVNDETAG